MTKTKTPFFSLGAQGSVGGSVTAQRRNYSTLVREKPFPSDPYSLPQAYQRWLYEDYAYLWTKQTPAVKQQYASAGVRFHLTGFQYWMKYHLKHMPDIVGWWTHDYTYDGLTPDLSRNAHPLIVDGPSLADGVIAGGYYFDGLNDRLYYPHHPDFNLVLPITIEVFVNPTLGDDCPLVSKGWTVGWTDWNYGLKIEASEIVRTGFADGVNTRRFWTTSKIPATWTHLVAVIKSPADMRIYFNAVSQPGVFAGTATSPSFNSQTLRAFYHRTWWYKGFADNLIIYNRELDENEIRRHSERRYSL